MWDFEHEPDKSRLAERYQIHLTTPAGCADELIQKTSDIGLVPVATYAFDPSLAVIPQCTIASLGDIRSILLGTGDATLVEHTENDAYWGDGGDGSGKNMLGKILMRVRERLRAEAMTDDNRDEVVDR